MLGKFFLRTVKLCWVFVASVIVLLAVLITTLKYALPFADDYKANIEAYVFENFGATISIGEIGASWQTSGPVIELYNLKLEPSAQAPLDIEIAETQLKVNFWRSLLEQRFVSETFILEGIQSKINSEVFYKVSPDSDGSELFDNLSHLFLSQLHAFKILNSELIVQHKDGRKQAYQLAALNWINSGNRHQASGTVFVDGFSNNSISFIADLYGHRRENIFGELYFSANKMDISPWLAQWINGHVDLNSTQVNFEAWGKIENGLVADLLMDMGNTGINWQQEGSDKFLGIKRANIHWQKADGEWVVFANNVKLETKQQVYPDFQFSFAVNENKKLLDIGNVDLQSLNQLFSLFSVTKDLDFLTKGELDGDVKLLQMLWDQSNTLSVAAEIDELKFEPYAKPNQAYLGFEDLKMSAYWQGQQGVVGLSGNKGQLLTRDTFSEVIDYEELSIQTYVNTAGANVVVSMPEIRLVNDEININLAAEFIGVNDGLLSLYGEVVGPTQGAIHQYLPRHLLGEETYQYLSDGIQQGRGEFTQVLLYGGLPDLLNTDKGQFLVKAQVRDGIFQFDSEWPQVESLDAELLVDADNFRIFGRSGEFSGLNLNNDLIVDIPLSTGETNVQILLTPEAIGLHKFHNLVDNTPLTDILGDVFDFVRLEGEATAVVNLTIPVSSDDDVVAQGTVISREGSIDLPELDLKVTELESIVDFKNEQVVVKGIKGNLYGLPVSFDVNGDTLGENYELNVDLIAQWQHNQIKQLYPNKLNKYFAGELTTELSVKVHIEDEGYQYYVDGKTDLTNASYEISKPLIKRFGKPSFADISVMGDEEANHFNIGLNDEVYFTAILDNEADKFTQTNLTIGSDETLLPEQGFDIKLDMPYAEFEPTLTFVVDLIEEINSSTSKEPATGIADNTGSTSIIDAPHHIYGNIQELNILEQTWNNVSLDGRPQTDGWLFSVGAKQTLTEVMVYDDIDDKGIDIKSKFLQIEVAESEEAENNQTAMDNPLPKEPRLRDSAGLIRSLPPLQVFCESCFYNGKPLGTIELFTHSEGPELIVEKATMQYKRNSVNLAGSWLGDSGEGRTQLSGNIKSRYFGDWLLEYGLDTGIKDSNASMELNLGWKSAPFYFGYETLNGSAKFKLGEGYFSDISDQGARLVSLLSLDSLYRKLKLDFNDIFEKGLFYNDLKGNIVIKDGVAYSENIKMDGVSGNMEMKGFTNLNTDMLDYNVSFRPNLTSSLGVLTWVAAANPITIIGAFALDKILEEEGALAEVRMKISGTLKEPVVEEVKRFKKKVAMPSKEEIDAFKQAHPLPEKEDD